jgi:hypothetical protein
MKNLFLLGLAVALVGCATGYHSNSFTGGFTELQLSENIYKVSFEGNGFTGSQKAENLALLRSADLTIQKGYKYFGIAQSSGEKSLSVFHTPTTTYFNGNSATSYGGNIFFVSKPSKTNIIVMMNQKQDGQMIYEAHFICKSLGEKYGVECGEEISK